MRTARLPRVHSGFRTPGGVSQWSRPLVEPPRHAAARGTARPSASNLGDMAMVAGGKVYEL